LGVGVGGWGSSRIKVLDKEGGLEALGGLRDHGPIDGKKIDHLGQSQEEKHSQKGGIVLKKQEKGKKGNRENMPAGKKQDTGKKKFAAQRPS